MSLVWSKPEVALTFLGWNPDEEEIDGEEWGREKRSLENILIPVIFTLGNKGTRPDCGRGRVIRSSGNSTEGKSEIQKSLGKSLWQPRSGTHRPRRNCTQMEIQTVPRPATVTSSHWTRR